MATLPDLPQTEIAIVEMTNAFRKESRLGEVKPNAALTAAARAFAEYLAKTGKFAHEAFHAFASTRDKRDVRALPCEFSHQRQPQSRGSAGDEHP